MSHCAKCNKPWPCPQANLMMHMEFGARCEHGSLARSCHICEVVELERQNTVLQEALDRFEQAGLYMEMLYPQIWDSALNSTLNPLAGEM